MAGTLKGPGLDFCFVGEADDAELVLSNGEDARTGQAPLSLNGEARDGEEGEVAPEPALRNGEEAR